jgi:protein phosphatase
MADHLSRILAVADGVSGGARGDVASCAAIEYVRRNHNTKLKDFLQFMQEADNNVKEAVAAVTNSPGGTTLVAAFIRSWTASHIILNVGDSRCYVIRREGLLRPRFTLSQVTNDQTVFQRALEKGVSLPAEQRDGPLVLGLGRVSEVDNHKIGLRTGDILLLCSDGIHKFISDEEILALATNSLLRMAESPTQMGDILVQAALKHGSYDDISLAIYQPGYVLGARLSFWFALILALLLLLFSQQKMMIT